MIIDKITFCTVIENLRQQMYLDRKNGEMIQEMFGSGSRCSYNDNLLVKSIMSLLQIHFPKDDDGFCRIEFYCDFLDFGKGSEEIVTAEELYDVLTTK
jgi:hypothetical protein